LLRVARSVFAKVGYEAASMEEIAREAGVTKPVVYEHFGGKEGLHAAIVHREMDVLVRRVSESISNGTPRARFEQAVLAFLTYVAEEPDGFAVLTRDAPTASARQGLTRVIGDLSERVGDIFEMNFKQAGYPTRTAPIYANALIGMVTQTGQWWVQSRSMPVDEVARHVAALGWMGLRHLPKVPASVAGKRRRS
jgi:AcrR family transcriptional regulator